MLAPGGRAGLQIITIRDELFERLPQPLGLHPASTSSPAACCPAKRACGRRPTAPAWTGTAIVRFGQDYADTLAEWAGRFEAAWDDIRPLGFDERFRRLWRFYLSYCEAGFRTERTNVVQLSLAKA